MTTTIFFVRHGVHDQLSRRLCGRIPGVLLGEAGLAEARAVGRRLKDRRVSAVFASPLERTRQTADAIAAACHVPVVEEAALLEIDLGDWNGASFDDLADQVEWRRWNSERDIARPPGGETMLEVQTRLLQWLETIVAIGPAAVAAVTHADIIKAGVALSLGLSLRGHDRLEVSPGSITTVIAGDWGLKLHSLNEAAE